MKYMTVGKLRKNLDELSSNWLVVIKDKDGNIIPGANLFAMPPPALSIGGVKEMIKKFKE